MGAGLDINALIADKVMNWHRSGDWWVDANDDLTQRAEYYDGSRGFSPTTDPNDIVLMRAELARQGLGDAFALALLTRLGTGALVNPDLRALALRNASPYHQCLAALSAVGIEA